MDKINFTFLDLAQIELPQLLEALTASKAYPINDLLGKDKVGVQTVLKELDKPKTDFRGLYIFIDENEQVIYTGISRKVITRLNQHINAKNHFSASFAYKLAKIKYNHKKGRKDLDPALITELQGYLKGLKVKFIEVDNPTIRYLFEVYVAMHFKTPHNSFETS